MALEPIRDGGPIGYRHDDVHGADHHASLLHHQFAGTLNFGSTGILSANIDATSTISVQCTNTTPYTISLNPGTGAGATVAARLMTSGANTVIYSLYRDSARTLVWGQTIGTDTTAGTGTGSSQNYTVYGRVIVQATPAPATFTDTITATVTY